MAFFPIASAQAQECAVAAFEAEQEYRLPPGLLHAIGVAESGGGAAPSESVAGWPWTTNAQGTDHYWPDKSQAVAAVRMLERGGVQSIDVGCFQINLMFHPAAFNSLEAAFDPLSNARAAARFLVELQRQTGNWPDAIMRYHSASPDHGPAYRDRVFALWSGAAPVVMPVIPATTGVHVWTPTNALAQGPATKGLPTVILPQHKG